MANWGDVCSRNGKFFVKVEAQVDGIRFHVKGPRRDDEQQAGQDLKYIRVAASGEASRLGELHAMKLAAKRLQDEAKVAMRGGIKTESADRIFARLQFTCDSVQEEITGPARAKADLAKLRQAAQGHVTVKESIAAMRQKSRELHQEADFELE